MAIEREKVLLQELNKANIRASQLEKTTKWWGECTANWREKWGKARNQRNKLREDINILNGQYTSLTIEYERSHNENVELRRDLEKNRVEKRIARVEPLVGNKTENCLEENAEKSTELPSTPGKQVISLEINSKCSSTKKDSGKDTDNSPRKECIVPKLPEDIKNLQQFLDNIEDKFKHSGDTNSDTNGKNFTDRVTNDIIFEKLKKIKDYVMSCDEFVDTSNRENEKLKMKLRDAETANTDYIKNYDEFKEQYEEWIEKYQHNQQNVTLSNRYGKYITEFKMCDLHTEIRRLQQENCNEWTKRDQCESDMSDLRRELKKSQEIIKEQQEELKRKNKEITNAQSVEMKLMKDELEQKSEAIIEMKSCLNKTKKQLQDKTEELNHEQKRTEQYDAEMKKLRSRIENLKQQVLTGEEKVDLQENHIRRLQRSLEEQTQQNEALQAQLQHVTVRLNRQSMAMNSKIKDDTLSDEES